MTTTKPPKKTAQQFFQKLANAGPQTQVPDFSEPTVTTPTLSSIVRIPLDQTIPSPYQHRLAYDPETLDALAQSMRINTKLDEPIRVRMVNGKYEILAGHRRVKAARTIGWTEIDAVIVEMDDRGAEISVILNNRGREDEGDIELALIYRRVLEKKLVADQKTLAELFATKPSAVSNTLRMLSLPAPIIELLKTAPKAISYTTAGRLSAILEANPGALDIVQAGISRVIVGEGKQGNLEAWVNQRIGSHARQKSRQEGTFVITKNNKPQIKVIRKEGSIEIRCANTKINPDLLLEAVTKLLEEKVETGSFEN